MQICYPFRKKLRRIGLVTLAAVLAALSAYFAFCKNGGEADETFAESGNRFAVTVNLTGDESEDDKRLLYGALSGGGIRAALFCGCDYIEAHGAELSEAVKNGHTVCILLSLPEKADKYELLRYIAAENDRFFLLTGKYPMYARIFENSSEDAMNILEKYGQIHCGGNAVCTAEGCGSGNVIALVNVNAGAVCMLMKTVTERQSRGMECVTPGELLRTAA